MNQITCPNCGTSIPIDESSFASIIKQVRDEQFAAEIAERQKLMERDKEQALKIAEEASLNRLQSSVAEREAKITELEARLAAASEQQRLVREQAAAEARAETQQLAAQEREAAQRNAAELQRQIDALTARLREQQNAAELARTRAVAAVERERDSALAELTQVQAVRDFEKQQLETKHAYELEQAKKTSAEIIRYKDEEIERLRDLKAHLSTKMLGESLERHCEAEFNRIRMAAFPNAYFEKDNRVVEGEDGEGTKGDYVFRECDADGNEIISIMFEMKNENDATASKNKNEKFFKKLDADRKKKGCEYAVLVSLLEPESELYNTGIVDVSHRFEKMYVIRPQFFIPMITLLRNAGLKSLAYRRELEQVRQQNIDVTNFEAKLDDFKDKFSRNYQLASDRFSDAIAAIDKGIKDLQTVREKLLASENYIRMANDKAQNLTIRKLTWGNKTMKAAFEEARAVRELAEPGESPAPGDPLDG